MKNIISRLNNLLILSLVLVLTLGGFTTSFADNDDWSAQSISNFLENKVDAPNILKDEKYMQNITREEFSELIIALYATSSKIDKNSIALKSNPFTDTNNIDVQRAYSLGIIKGISKDKFSPNSNISREEIATMITRFLNIKGIDTATSDNLNTFIDKKSISSWAFNSLAYCVHEEIIKGFDVWGDKQLQPKGKASVEQVITILDRIAIKNAWIIESKYKYINGFYIPSDTKVYVSNWARGIFIKIEWNKIDNLEKMKNDLYYIFKENKEYKEFIDYITDMKNTTPERFYIDGYDILVNVSPQESSAQVVKRLE
jgi:hypothetical protein